MTASRNLNRWSFCFGVFALIGSFTGMSDILFAAFFVSAVIIGTAGDVLKAFDK